MAEKKKQHYVPKLYLRQFSINENNNQIGLFFIDKEYFNKAVPLKSQAQEDYFYGADGVIEEELSELETKVAPFLRKIISTNVLPNKQHPEHLTLLAFTFIMASRTKDSAEQMKEMTDKLFRELMSYEVGLRDKVENIRIYPVNPSAMALDAAKSTLPAALDLKVKLLINKTTIKFITSDHPVVKYNQFLEERGHQGGNVGVATKGLQVFFPISPKHMLCFYDGSIYKIGSKSQNNIEIINPSDVDSLNYSQVLNCYNHLYFNHETTEKYIKALYSKAKEKRLEEYSVLRKRGSYIDVEGNEHIQYHSYGYNIKIKLQLSFIKQTKRAKKHVLSDYIVQLRNESLRGSNENRSNFTASPIPPSF